MAMIRFDREICRDLEAASRREWLETNGLGGFASSTITGLNTRRYHGLLVAATRPPVGRLVLLSKMEEALVLDGRRYELSANRYPGIVHPQGHEYLKEFRLDPFPVFTYEVEGMELIKSVFLIYGENSAVIQYEARGARGKDCLLEARPLVAFRDYHGTTHENSSLDAFVQTEENLAIITPYEDLPSLYFAHDATAVDRAGFWYRNFEYDAERERGLDFAEDLYSPFALKFDLNHNAQAAVIASTERRDRDFFLKDFFLARRASDYRQSEIERRNLVIAPFEQENELVRQLAAASRQYIVARGEQKTVIAGYHWFSDWGRDTMIALPGLTLATGRADVAKSIMLEFARHLDQGMLPNRFPDAGESPEYNTVDATLWFFEAVRSLLDYTGDYEFVRENLYAPLTEVIDWHTRGTRYGIKVDEDGLLASGEDGVQLTWMDAKVGDWVVTPRHGKAVEIQALWYNALRVMERLAQRFGDEEGEKRFADMAALARRSFNRLFWNEEAECLYDVIDKDRRDPSIRPNQIFAVSLYHTMLSQEKARKVVEAVESRLLTPYGLRSLAPDDPQYRPRYEGGVTSRDGAYHQGTVWAWLMGPFITAYVKVKGRSGGKKSRARAALWLEAFHDHLSDAGLGHVSEIFDADSPHTPRGCIAQAWSVAELLRAAIEDVYCVKPAESEAPAALKAGG
ncbi:MAG: amylo-alpha-1,6-glucosidase [Blastocatellia bacterium]|nr:amylo-alpha-1,6-glucosidase [Blastocatellia bacterium]